MSIDTIAAAAAFILIGLGFFSIFLPVAPSIPVIWLGMFVYAFSRNFAVIDRVFMAIVSLIAIATIFLDYTLYRFGVQKFRAGLWEVLGAILGFVVGSFFAPLVAYLIGPVIGAIAFGTLRGRDQIYSWRTGNTTVVAFMGGTIVKLVAALTIIGLFILRLRGKL